MNIEVFRDETVEGILSLPNVSGYVNSKAKLDATMVLSVDYQKNASTTVAVPLYSYREHGNGRVATFTSSLSGDWLENWGDADKAAFFGNVLVTNTPTERIDYPYTLTVEYGGDSSTIEIVPSDLNPTAVASVKITAPDGTVAEQQLVFDLNRYFTSFDTPDTGKYNIEITYSYGTHSFSSINCFNVPYYSEYDAFAVFDVASIHKFMRGIGQISTDGTLNLETDKNKVDTYELNFRIPLLIIAVVLFVVDVAVRKMKWKDIKDLFLKITGKGGAQQ